MIISYVKKVKSIASPQSVIIKIIRVPRADSAYVYAILESYENTVSYSTLDSDVWNSPQGYCDLEVSIPPAYEDHAMRMLSSLQTELSGELYVIHTNRITE
jgi:hypothetical protein